MSFLPRHRSCLITADFPAVLPKPKILVMHEGSFVLEKVEEISVVSAIVAERDSTNKSGKQISSMLPHELAILEHIEISTIFSTHRECLLPCWIARKVGTIRDEHQALVATYNEELPLRSTLSVCDEDTTIDGG